MAGPSSSSTLPHSSFIPRPFPPPALETVPLEYIIDSLHKLAPRYWNNVESADCSIIFPVKVSQAGQLTGDPNICIYEPHNEITINGHDPSGLGRRVTAPALYSEPPQMMMRLHIDYLSSQSTLLRGLFSGSSPLDLINTTKPLVTPASASSQRQRSGANASSNNPLQAIPHPPRLLPSHANHPIVYLPVPDPTSFHYLITWMYFGRTDEMEAALHHRKIHWAGLASNVEYLGMPNAIKKFLGNYYSRWLQPGAARPRGAMGDSDDEFEGETVIRQERGRSRDRNSPSSTILSSRPS